MILSSVTTTAMINWKAVPALRMLAPLCTGIFLATALPDFFSFSTTGCIFLLPLLYMLSLREKASYARRWWFGICLSLFWLFAGYSSVGYHDEYSRDNHFARHISDAAEARIFLLVDEPPVLKSKVRLIGEVSEFAGQPSCGHLLVYLDSTAFAAGIRYGDIVALSAQVKPIAPSTNPFAYDFQNAMKLKNVRHSAFVKSETAQLLARERANPLMHLAYNTQESLIRVLGKYIQNADALSVGSALILGYRSDISEEVTQAYADTGAMHVLSVSGLHVGLVASLFAWLLGRWRGGGKQRKVYDALIQLALVWGFALITGASSCVLRAAVMFGFVIVGKSFSRDANTYNALLASAFFLLLYNPWFLFDLSFQLSYLGLLGILFFHPYIYRYGLQKVWWFSEYYIMNQIWNLTAVSCAAMLTTTPLSLYYFHRFPVHFWLSGLVVVPLATVVLYLGLFLFVISKWGVLAFWTGKLLEQIILLMNKALKYIGQIPPGVLRDFSLQPYETAIWYVVLFCLAAALYEKKMRWLHAVLALSLLLALNIIVANYRAAQQHFLVVYDAKRELLLDIFEGRRVESIQSSGLGEKKEQFTAMNNRLAHGVLSVDVNRTFLSTDSTGIRLFCHRGKNIMLLRDGQIPDEVPVGLLVDYLIVYESPWLDFNALTNRIHIGKIVFTGSNRPKSLAFYKRECLRLGLEFHDTGSSGALTVQL